MIAVRISLLFTLMMYFCTSLWAQWLPVTHRSGTQAVGVYDVTVTPTNTGVGWNTQCSPGYWIGYNNAGGGYNFKFSTPVKRVRIAISICHIDETINVVINDTAYALKLSELSPYYVIAPCDSSQINIVGGNVKGSTNGEWGSHGMVEISGRISSVGVYSLDGAGYGSVLNLSISDNSTTCNGIWGPAIVNQTFGQGNATDIWYGPLTAYAPGASTATTFVGVGGGSAGGKLANGESGLVKNSGTATANHWWSNHTDHTGNPYGLMMLINAPLNIGMPYLEYWLNHLCPNTTLRLSAWIRNTNSPWASSSSGYLYPNVILQVVDSVTGTILGKTLTGNIPADTTWHQYSIIFNNGSSSSVKLQLINNVAGASVGNDLAIDDITVQPCVPTSMILPKLDTMICQNATLSFNANILASPYNPVEYQWQYSADTGTTWLNQGLPSGSPSYTFDASKVTPGTYWLRYKAGPQGATVNDNCFAFSDTSIITVNVPPLPVLTYVSEYCTGTSFAGFTVMSGVNLKWYDSAVRGVGSTAIPAVHTSTPGQYQWYVSQTTIYGCESARLPVNITVARMPKSDFTTMIGFACMQDTVRFQNTSLDGNNYIWNFGDSTFTSTVNPVHIYNKQGAYNVMLASYNSFCADTVYKIVTMEHPLVADFTANSFTICESDTLNFMNTTTATTVNGIDPVYRWDFKDGTTLSSLQHPSHKYSAPGVYEVSLVANNSIPCYDTVHHIIYVDSLSYVSFTLSDTTICMGDYITFNANYTNSGLMQLLWNFDNSADTVYQVNSATHAYERKGVYTVSLNARYRACANVNASARVIVKALPKIDIGRDTAICLNGTHFTLADPINAGNPGASWLWSTGDTLSVIAVKHQGEYWARVTVDQCSATDRVEIQRDCSINIPNSFTPNGDDVNDYFFPRQLLSSGIVGFKMIIFNQWGQKVFETQNTDGRGWDGKFNGKNQPVGVYVFQIKVVLKNARTEEYMGNVTLLQ